MISYTRFNAIHTAVTPPVGKEGERVKPKDPNFRVAHKESYFVQMPITCSDLAKFLEKKATFCLVFPIFGKL